MGKCIVCGKSAGLFYSLHKLCYQHYERIRDSIDELLDPSRDNIRTVASVISDVDSLLSQIQHRSQLWKGMLTGVWEKKAAEFLKMSNLSTEGAHTLQTVFEHCHFSKDDLRDKYLLTKLGNVTQLIALRQDKLVVRDIDTRSYSQYLDQDEKVIWLIEKAQLVGQHAALQDRRWTIIREVVEAFKTPKYVDVLQRVVQSEGILLFTNKNIRFIDVSGENKISFQEIASVTPLGEGIEIQRKDLKTKAETYVTGDGRFIYELLKKLM